MKKLIPLKKQSKSAQKEHAALQRGSWEGVKPVTRVEEVLPQATGKARRRRIIARKNPPCGGVPVRQAHNPFDNQAVSVV